MAREISNITIEDAIKALHRFKKKKYTKDMLSTVYIMKAERFNKSSGKWLPIAWAGSGQIFAANRDEALKKAARCIAKYTDIRLWGEKILEHKFTFQDYRMFIMHHFDVRKCAAANNWSCGMYHDNPLHVFKKFNVADIKLVLEALAD